MNLNTNHSPKYETSLNPLDRIRFYTPQLSKTHKKIGRFILENYEKATFLTSAKLSQQCGVSESSVIRFSTALGYSGYSEMQRELQEILKRRLSLSQRLELTTESNSDSNSIMHSVMMQNINSIRETMMNLDEGSFQSAVELLSHADRVFLYGQRSSYALIYFLGLELRWIRDNVVIINGHAQELDALSTITKSDVLLAISLPRYLKATTKVIQFAWEREIPTIAITDTKTSPLIPYASVSLLANSDIYSYSDNIVPIASTITALLNAIGAATQPTSNEMLAKNEQLWKSFDMYI